MDNKSFKKNVPPRMAPNKLIGFKKYKMTKYQKKAKVPEEYQKAAKALQLFFEQKIPIENTINTQKKSPIHMKTYSLAIETIKRLEQINYILDKLNVLEDNKTLNPWLARVVVTEMLFSKQQYASSMASDIETMKYYEESMRDIFVETTSLIPDQSDVQFPVYVRINVLSISIDDSIRAFFKEGWNLLPRFETYEEYLVALRQLQGRNFMRDFHISELLVFPPRTLFYDHPGYLRGKFLLQDKGSCLSSFLLNPKPGSIVLDICAAPGLKTNHLANIINNEGLIIANDDHPFRYDILCKLLDLTDAKCVQTCQFDHLNIYTNKPNLEKVQYILVDPTCSYSGLFYKYGKLSAKLLDRIRFRSSMLLRYCLQTFPNIKRLVYTTCSVSPEEGERVVMDVLEAINDSYTLLDVKEMLWNQWIDLGQGKSESVYCQFECSKKCLRTIPDRDLTPGYFIAVFERNYDVPVPPYSKIYKRGSKTYTADQLEKVEKVKRTGEIVQTYVPKEKLRAQQSAQEQVQDPFEDQLF